MNKQFQYELYGSKLLPVSHIISTRGTSVVAWNNKLNKTFLHLLKKSLKNYLIYITISCYLSRFYEMTFLTESDLFYSIFFFSLH